MSQSFQLGAGPQNREQAARQLLTAGVKALGARNLKAAVEACRQLNSQFSDYAEGWALGSQVAQRLGNQAKALEFIEKAIALKPKGRAFNVTKAECLYALKRFDEARAAIDTAAIANEGDAHAMERIGHFLSLTCNEHQQAKTFFEKAVKLDPKASNHWYNLGAVERYLGNIKEAESCWDKAIELGPSDTEIYLGRSQLRKQTAKNNHLANLSGLLDTGLKDWRDRVNVNYALAKEYEDLEDYPASFSNLKAAADTRRAHIRYDVADDIAVIDKIIETFDSTYIESPDDADAGADTPQPIFVLGLPRTGTTLIERILGSHSEVTSAGELNDFAIVLVREAQKAAQKAQLPRDELVEVTRQLEPYALGKAYMEAVAHRIEAAPNFIDKMPLNFLYCGLIHAALPGARIVHLRRHPLDAIYSIYKQLFKNAYPMSYDLEDLARYYVAYRRLMDHWKSVIPDRFTEIRYENVIADQEAETRRLIETCGLGWENACLSFENNPMASTTASATQVRQKIYSSSVGRWRNVEAHLDPAIQILEAAGINLSEESL